jgi:hypothetical protein
LPRTRIQVAGTCQPPQGEALRVATKNGAYVPSTSGASANAAGAAVLLASVAVAALAAF